MNKEFNKYFLNSLSFKELRDSVHSICTLYKASNRAINKIELQNKISNNQYLGENVKLNNTIFDNILNILEPLHKEIIINSFIKNSNKRWFENQYSLTTFQKLKRKAMEEFLCIYQYMIWGQFINLSQN